MNLKFIKINNNMFLTNLTLKEFRWEKKIFKDLIDLSILCGCFPTRLYLLYIWIQFEII